MPKTWHVIISNISEFFFFFLIQILLQDNKNKEDYMSSAALVNTIGMFNLTHFNQE
jgi:hypothetical protein